MTAAISPRAQLRLVRAPERRTAESLIDEAQGLEREGRRLDARSLFHGALTSLASTDTARASAVLRWIALSFERDSDYEAAADSAEAAVAVAECAHDRTALGLALNVMGGIRWRQGALDEAGVLLRAALEHGRNGTDPNLVAYANTNLGTIASVRGDFHLALRHFEESLAHSRLHGLPESILPTLINLGVTNMALERLDTANAAFSEAAMIAEALDMMSSCVLVDINRASLEIARHDFASARRRCDSAIALAEHLEDALSFGEAQKVYGVIERETGRFAEAESRLKRALQLATEVGDALLQGETCSEMAELYRQMGRNRDTLRSLNMAHARFNTLRSRHQLADVARRMSRLEGEFLDVVRVWGESIESKDLYTQGHCVRVADLATALAARSGMDEHTLIWFRIGALLHDVGKLIIPPEVLNKPGKLTDDEWTLMRRHPVAGVEMLADVEFPWDIAPMVRSHHERWDGRGYPDALHGEEIALPARILCIADVYDALTSARSYKRPYTHDEAMDIMRGEVGAQFDPGLFPLFEELFRETSPAPASPESALTPEPAAAAQSRA